MSEVLVDDFMGGAGADGGIGKLGWRTGAGTVTPGSGTTDHPGVIALVTGGVANDTCRIHLGRTVSTAVADIGQVLRWQATVALASTANCLVRVGWGTDISSGTFGTDGVYWQISSADGTVWKLNTQNGGSAATVSSAVAGSTSYFTLAAYRQGDRWIGLVNAGGTETRVTSTAGTEPVDGTALNFGFYVQTLTGAAKTLSVDAWGMRYCHTIGPRKYL